MKAHNLIQKTINLLIKATELKKKENLIHYCREGVKWHELL